MANNSSEKEQLLAQAKAVIIESITKAFPNNKEVVDNMPAIAELLMRVTLAHDEKTGSLGNDFLDEAYRDVQSCKLLYSKKIYPHAVYHLQQAIEKAIKGYVLVEGYYEAGELEKIMTHHSPEVLLKAIIERTGIKDFAEQITDKTLETKISSAKTTIGSEEKRIEIAKTDYNEILRSISQIDEYRKNTELIERAVINGFKNIGISPVPGSISKSLLSMVTIMVLAILTFPHESYTRYPDGKMVPKDYRRGLGIVRAVPRLLKLLETEIDNLKRIHEFKNETL